MKRGRDFLQRTISGFVADVSIPQVDVQPFVVHKFSSQDRILQCTVEQISCCSGDADRAEGRVSSEQSSDIPVPQVVEELVEVFTVSPRTGFNIVLWS